MSEFVRFPPYLKAMKFPGYFYHMHDNRVFTIKITGELRPLKVNKISRWVPFEWVQDHYYYAFSVAGRRKYVGKKHIHKYLYEDYTIKVAE